MIERTTIITARRAYLFPVDAIRLTTLSTAGTPDVIQQYFGFKAAAIGTPQATFGEVPVTMPPGLVFNLGSVQSSEGVPTPIRFIHFEPQRVVIDVAGPSSVIDEVYEQLRNLLSGVRTSDGSPVIGDPTDSTDYSEITARLGFAFSELVNESVLAVARQMFVSDEEGVEALPTTLMFHVGDPSLAVDEPGRGQALQLRVGTRVDERMYFSVVGLPTDENLAWLEALDQRLGQA